MIVISSQSAKHSFGRLQTFAALTIALLATGCATSPTVSDSSSREQPFQTHAVIAAPQAPTNQSQRALHNPQRQKPQRTLNLWTTFYHVHLANQTARGIPLLGPDSQPIGTSLKRKDWCLAALEGTVYVPQKKQIYNYFGRGDKRQTDCSSWLGGLSKRLLAALETTLFSAVAAPYGTGAGGSWLVPYRSMAVDPATIPLGSVLYLPAVDGNIVTLPNGKTWRHDGYFLATDTGGAIKQQHVDIFTGVAAANPFPTLRSGRKHPFKAVLINDPKIEKHLRSLHKPR